MKLIAQSIQQTFGTIQTPSQISGMGTGAAGINTLLDNVVGIFFAAAGMAFIIMFVWGAVQMILSGGDKEAVSKARGKITWAIIGIVLMSISYLILYLLQTITGFKFFVK
jgi:CHASE2 domain-containing sensor protein